MQVLLPHSVSTLLSALDCVSLGGEMIPTKGIVSNHKCILF